MKPVQKKGKIKKDKEKSAKIIILASGSRDRNDLLKKLGIPYIKIVSNAEETIDRKTSLEENVIRLALLKLESVKGVITSIRGHPSGEINNSKFSVRNLDKSEESELRNAPNFVIIAADTMVGLEGNYIGKASDKEHAFKILKLLSGKTHELITGVAIFDSESEKTVSFSDVTQVKFVKLDDEEIHLYLNNFNEYKGRAGAYSIQERASVFTESVRGSITNVIGLPINRIFEILKEFDINLLEIMNDSPS